MKLTEILKVVRKTFITPIKARKSYSQCAEDLIVEQHFGHYFKQGSKGFYVDAGSHHPIRGSNSFRLYKAGWKGILIDMEESKVLSAKLARPRDQAVKAAISDKKEYVTIYSPSKFSTNATISTEVIVKATNLKPVSSISTTTLDVLLERYNCPRRFEFLSIDLEGQDYKALLGLSFEKFSPKLICIENHESSLGIVRLLESKIHQHLTKNSYEFCGWSGPSTFYRRCLAVK